MTVHDFADNMFFAKKQLNDFFDPEELRMDPFFNSFNWRTLVTALTFAACIFRVTPAVSEETDRAIELLKLAMDCRSQPVIAGSETDKRQTINLNEFLGDKTLYFVRWTRLSSVHEIVSNISRQQNTIIESKVLFSELDPKSIELQASNTLAIGCVERKSCVDVKWGKVECGGRQSTNCGTVPTKMEPLDKQKAAVAIFYVCSRESFNRAKLALEVLIDSARTANQEKK